MGFEGPQFPTNQRMILLYFIELVIQVYQHLAQCRQGCSGLSRSVGGGVGCQNGTSALKWVYTAFWSFTTKWGQESTKCLKKKEKNSEPNPTGVKVPRKDFQTLSALGLWAWGTRGAHWGWASRAGGTLNEMPRPVCSWCTGLRSPDSCQGLQVGYLMRRGKN